MKKNIFLLAIIIFSVNFSISQKNKGTALEQYARVKFKVETMGDITYGKNENYSQINVTGILKELNNSQTENSLPLSVSYTYFGCSTIYDYVSNATPQNIVQDPNNTNRIHIVCMSSPWGDPHPNFPGRRIKYYYSSNKGTSWNFVADIPNTRGGFPQIVLAPNGNALISGNIGSGSNETVRWYYDAAPGLGSFTELYPPIAQRYLFPRTVSTSSLTNANKFISVISSYDLDSTFWINCTLLSPSPGTFSPPNLLNAKPAECYAIARGNDGRIGIVYIVNNLLLPADIGDVYFVETTNGGATFNNPLKIFDANISLTGDSLGAFRGISMVYYGNDPKVVFETVKQTSDGYYFPGVPAKIRFWSNTLSGIDPNKSIVIVDTSKIPFNPYISKGLNNDLFASLNRPSIGKSIDGSYYNSLYVAFMVPSACVGGKVDSISFMDMWLVYSTNSGSFWSNCYKINSSFPRLDYTYPCISPSNDNTYGAYNTYPINMNFLLDSIPGSFINHSANGQSLAKFMFIRKTISELSYNINEPYFVLISPLMGATNVSLNPNLDWVCSISGSVYHRAQISTNPLFNVIFLDTVISQTQVTVPNGKLNVSTTYYWRVCVGDSIGHSNWSSIWSFTTRSTGINKISSETPTEYKLYQNYPNPFNPATIIKFQIKDSRHGGSSTNVKLIVYDILGKEIATLVNEKLSPGFYETEFNVRLHGQGSNLASGIYFYKLETENFTDVKRMILIK